MKENMFCMCVGLGDSERLNALRLDCSPAAIPPEVKPAAPRTGAAAAIGATMRGTATAPTATHAVVPGFLDTQPAAYDRV